MSSSGLSGIQSGTVRSRADEDRSIIEVVGVPVPCRRLEAGDGPRQMADQVMNAVDELLLSGKTGMALRLWKAEYTSGWGVTVDEAATCGNHYRAVRFR